MPPTMPGRDEVAIHLIGLFAESIELFPAYQPSNPFRVSAFAEEVATAR
jgi:hypothetical protein